MIDERSATVERIPIDRIVVANPRARGSHKFRQIVNNISNVGLKKPITVAPRGDRDGEPVYELVCGQGRLEACQQLGETTVPALVVKASAEELMLMSLAENLARRRQTSVQTMREIAALKDRGYTYAEIAQKTDLHVTYVKGIVRLLKHGEERLLLAVERGHIPINIAVTIATSSDEDIQRALAEAYQSNNLRGKELLRARRLIESRRASGKGVAPKGRGSAAPLTGDTIMQTYKRETTKQRLLVQKAKVCETRLLFVVSALKQLMSDPAFVAIVQSAGLDNFPQHLAEKLGHKEP